MRGLMKCFGIMSDLEETHRDFQKAFQEGSSRKESLQYLEGTRPWVPSAWCWPAISHEEQGAAAMCPDFSKVSGESGALLLGMSGPSLGGPADILRLLWRSWIPYARS